MMDMMMGLSASEQQQQGWRKGPWTPEEDKLLTEYVNLHGEGRWSSVAKCSGLNRSSKSCRLRWVNYLRPGLKRGRITPQEEGIIIELHALWGNKWSTIARYLPGRTDNEIKNYWRTHFKKKGKASGKQEKRKIIRQHKQEQQDNDNNNNNGTMTTTKVSPQSEVINIENQNISEPLLLQGKQEMLCSYPSMDFQFLPTAAAMYGQDVASWSDIIPVDGLWGGLWNLDDQQGDRVGQQANECGKIVIAQNQPINCSTEGDNLNIYNGEYIF